MTSVKLLSWIGGSLTSLNFFPWAKTKEKLQQFDDPLCKREMAERQIAERALAESEIFFQSIFENTAMGIALIDLDGHVVRMNPTYSQMLGYEEGELLNKHFREYTYKEDIPGDLEAFVQLQKLKYNQYQRTKRYLNKNGNLIWVNLTVSLVRDRQGEPQYAIAMMENITERKAAERELLETKERLERLVKARTEELIQINEELTRPIKHDRLTGLLNRYEFEQQLTALLKAKRRPNYEEEERENQSDSLCYLNLDRFKTVNETYGHLAGDELLRKVSMIIKACCRHSDTVARVGGDKFAILLYKCPLTEAETVAEKISTKIKNCLFTFEEQSFCISCSIGLVSIDCQWESNTEVLMAADAACYGAKEIGPSRIHVYGPNDQALAQHRNITQWVGRIEEAIKKDLFQLYYQSIVPIQGADDATQKHYEILIRLVDEEGKVISPGAFIPSAERYNLMFKIDCWVISHLFAYIGSTKIKEGLYCINLSGQSINDDRLLDFIKEQFALYQISPEIICFEITETVAVSSLTKTAPMIQEIRDLGCSIALDDFGSGMSSFSYLKYLPVDYLKIDGAFVKDIGSDPVDLAIVKAIDAIGHAIGLKTIAEYVSSEDILTKVTAIGVDYAQGYAILKPKPLTAMNNEQ